MTKIYDSLEQPDKSPHLEWGKSRRLLEGFCVSFYRFFLVENYNL